MNFDHPKWVVFQITEKCNLRCKMCYEWGDNGSYFNKSHVAELDINVMESIIKDLSQIKSPYYELFGGEPLLYSNLERLLYTFLKYDCKVDIPTNGTLLMKHANLLVDSQVRRIWVSIDGNKEINDLQRGRGVFETAVAGLEELFKIKNQKCKSNPLIGVTMVVTPLNYLNIEEFFTKEIDSKMLDYISIEFQLYTTENRYNEYIKFINKEFGVYGDSIASGLIRKLDDFKNINIENIILQMTTLKKFCFENNIELIGYPKTITVDNLKSFYTGNWDHMEDKRNSCSFPWLYLEISAKGDVTPCHTFYDVSIGNVYEENITDIWKGNKLIEFRKKLRGKIMPICCSCSRYYSDL